MNYLIYVYLIMVGVFFTYLGFILLKYGILPSISDSWYHLSKKLKPLFTLFCWGIAFPAMIIGLTISEGNQFQFLIFLGASGIMFVGVAPDFMSKNGLDKKIHRIAAIVGVVANTLYAYLVFPSLWYIPTIFVISTLILFAFKRKVQEILWIEVLSFTCYAMVSGIEINRLLSII